ncbi:hypothetical protein P175DRAFT_0519192 [Aspergillus ochraceoroseus IBT 24754]|uniref:Subtelomeric hrmA-associated cluster protein AFUB-079030/YDR124W-like helical bundle domain-containing protein n=1 Tax=Aspergillus ochraceoroseus IBT 24754 TaxID=1392256 RepID=A0A2T5LMP9_9EURO|nr:uncharacterized protein P175DRAFT_0519192 [Aspergillus ochraceoroseus IBT 24754]PTU17562.1 hypothetical protein P175DRAFT_0519192 [Aspergillus ochraceoroseus IBT 24754]
MTSPTYRMDPIDQSVVAKEEEQHQMASYHDMTAQTRSTEIQCSQSAAFAFPYSHFAMMYIDRNGELQLEASNSITGGEKSIFTEEIQDRFLRLVNGEWQPHLQNFHSGLQSSWYHPSQPRPASLIPCEWQSHQNKRHRRNLRRVDSAIGHEWEPSSPSPSVKRTAIRVGQRSLLRSYYEKAFEYFQQLNCRVIAKAFVKLVEPRKQVNHPYNGRKTTAGSTQRMDPELTKPKWWPAGVTHKEPDHLLKAERIRLLVHILCELRDSHGITADKLKDAGQDVRRQILPSTRLQVLDEIYYVREMEELYLDGKISGDTIVHVSHVHMDEELQELQEQVDSEGIHNTLVPTITVQEDVPLLPDTHSVNRSNGHIPLTSDDHRPQSMGGHPKSKRPANQDCYLPLSPASSPSVSRKSSLERSLSTYSSDIDPSMLSSNHSTKNLTAPKGFHSGGSSSVPDYFAHQLMAQSTAQNPHSGFWNTLPNFHAQLAFPGY